jgi:[ribosomal protein S5]-alanine N-acetyltransferase
MKDPQLETERLILRLITSNDIPEVIRYFKSNEAHFAPTSPLRADDFFSEEFWRGKPEKVREDFNAGRVVKFYLFDRESNRRVLGDVELSQIARGPFQACYLGYGLGEEHQGKGFMLEALKAMIHYAFSELNLHRIMANHLPDNIRSANVLSRLGFTREGVAKDYLLIRGQWRDHVLNSLVNPNWRKL